MTDLSILHLFSNFKWTGPADPAIRCAHGLRQAGADVLFAQATWTLPDAEHRMRKELTRWRMPVTADLELRKHFSVPSLLRDARTLRARLRRGDFDLLHCHLLADHLMSALARRGCGRRVVLVRSLYDPEPPSRTWRNRLAFRATDGVVAPTRRCTELVVERFGLPAERVLFQEPPVDPAPAVPATAVRELRGRLGLAPEHVAIGITARIQPHRRFDLLWETARRVVDAEPRARFVLLGRGNERDTHELVREPIRRLGLEQCVALPGYLYEPDYSAALAGLDLFLFLVPGSDGTCRAVREAMARGLPVIATARGLLPELLATGEVLDRACGVVCEENADSLAAALVDLIRDEPRRQRLAAASQEKAAVRMNPRAAAAELLAFYSALAAAPRGRS